MVNGSNVVICFDMFSLPLDERFDFDSENIQTPSTPIEPSQVFSGFTVFPSVLSQCMVHLARPPCS